MMKKILTGCLLVFVAISVAYAIVNETKDVSPIGSSPAIGVVAVKKVESAPVAALPVAPVEPVQKEPVSLPVAVSPLSEPAVASTPPVVPAERGRVVVYYFHGNMRCPTCRAIEALTREAIETGFARDLADGKMEMLAVNVDEPANGHFVTDYQLVTKSVVVVRFEGDLQKEWKNLDQVWQQVQDKDAFIRYIQDETTPFLQEGK